jgi:hypothetical protein
MIGVRLITICILASIILALAHGKAQTSPKPSKAGASNTQTVPFVSNGYYGMDASPSGGNVPGDFRTRSQMPSEARASAKAHKNPEGTRIFLRLSTGRNIIKRAS